MITIVGERESSVSVWSYPDTGGATPDWTADTGGHTNAVAIDSSGNVFVVGENSSSKNIWKYDSTGSLQESLNIGGTTLNMHDIKVLSDDTLVVGGQSDGSDYSLWSIDNSLSAATQRGGTTAGTTPSIDVDSSDNIYVLHITTAGTVASRFKYNSSWVEQYSGFQGVGSAIDLNFCGIAGMLDGGMVVSITYSVGYMRYYDNTGTGGGNISLGNSFTGPFVDSDGYVYLCQGTTIHKYEYTGGAFVEEWSNSDAGIDTSDFFQDDSGNLYNVTYNFSE